MGLKNINIKSDLKKKKKNDFYLTYIGKENKHDLGQNLILRLY